MANRQLRLAILDNFSYQKYITTRVKEFYINGIDLAVHDAKEHGIDIVYRVYQYEPDHIERLAIRKQLPALLKWKPDVIIGPRDSNNFLLLKYFIKDVLTISSFATANGVAQMPKNFYSMELPVKYSAKAMYDFITADYPKSAAFVITDVECKSCDDESTNFVNLWKANNPLPIVQHYFLTNDASTLNLEELLRDYKKGDVILLPNNAHETAIMMALIEQIIPDDAVFVGGDGWGAWNDTEVGKFGADKNYTAYHLTPWNIDVCTPRVKRFYTQYNEYYKKQPESKLSYLSYETLMAVVIAIEKYHDKRNQFTPPSVLLAFQDALKENPNWFRPMNYAVMRIHKGSVGVFAIVDNISNKIRYANNNRQSFQRCSLNE